MFEQETDQLLHMIRFNTIGQESSVGLRTILESAVPASVKTFFRGEVEWLLFEERQKEIRSPKFDYAQSDVQILQDQIDTLLVNNYVFSAADFHAYAGKCALFLFNYLCRPQWTLRSFLFEFAPIITPQILRQKFRYCHEYRYYGKLLEHYIAERKKSALSSEDASGILQKIDAEIVRDHSPREMANLVQPLFSFVGHIRGQMLTPEKDTLPIRALMYFYEDKGLSSISQTLSRFRDAERVAEISFVRLCEALEGRQAVLSSGSPQHTVLPVFSAHGSRSTAISAFALPENEHRSIMKNIFRNDDALYRRTVDIILSKPSWNDAALALDHYFTMNDIEPFTKEAIIFTNALQEHFTRTSHS